MMAKRVTVDLEGQMALCEANYARLMKLMPLMASEPCREFMVSLPGDHTAQFKLEVIERCKYTTILDFSQLNLPFSEQLEWAPAPHFRLRAYHDAQMAEVSAFHSHHRLRSNYQYPNKTMFHRDEKVQLNQLLSEWLIHCLQHGHSLEALNCQ